MYKSIMSLIMSAVWREEYFCEDENIMTNSKLGRGHRRYSSVDILSQ